jgi:hypothetical protein
VHVIPAEQMFVVAAPARLLPIVTSAAAALPGSCRHAAQTAAETIRRIAESVCQMRRARSGAGGLTQTSPGSRLLAR